MTFNPANWYWAAADGRVFKSATGAIVGATDPDFVAWTGGGGRPTPWPRDDAGEQTDAALQGVLDAYGLFVSLDALKAALKVKVDASAEALRLTLITPGSGQAMEYQEAYNEAVLVSNALAASPSASIDPAKFPMLSASLGYDLDPATGKPTPDIAGEARAVLAAYDAYQKVGAAIRGVRLRAKAAIEAAADATDAQAVFAAIVWPQLG